MADTCLMGVDVGTQGAKVVIFDLFGTVVCEAGHPLRPMEIPAPQQAIHPDDNLWNAMVHVGKVFGPDMDHHRFYDRLNRTVYQTVNSYFDPVLSRLSRLVDDPNR